VNIQRRSLRGSHHIRVAAGTDTLFTLYELVQILRQVERASKVFSQYPAPSRGETGVGWGGGGGGGGWENAKVSVGSIRNTAVHSPRKEADGRQAGADGDMQVRGQRDMSPTYDVLVTKFRRQRAHACYYIDRDLNVSPRSQTSSSKARAITLPSFKLLSGDVRA